MPLANSQYSIPAWSIQRPISILMLALTVIVIGLFSLDSLRINLLPHLIYPEVRVRIFDNTTPASIMEDQITRQLEEQLAITEGVELIQSSTSRGRTAIDLSFPYGTDINLALRDASTRLDRAKRFLPTTIEPPVIYKRDPMQIPVSEFVISSKTRDSKALREWVDYHFRNWLINTPGVASAETGGGTLREFRVVLDQEKLFHAGISYSDIIQAIRSSNRDYSAGQLVTSHSEINVRTLGRITSIKQLSDIVLKTTRSNTEVRIIKLRDVAQIEDGQSKENLRIRLNTIPGVKLSIQKQPQANTVEVVDEVKKRLAWLKQQGTIPDDITVTLVDDQSVFIRHAINNAALAVITAALLATIVVYLFLGNIFHTIVIAAAIPLAIFSTFTLMSAFDLTLNIMTLGGLALGVGLLIDNTIIMLENITRHQKDKDDKKQAAIDAAKEIGSAMLASTSTNLAAIMPFLFIGGLTGLLFNELIYTLSAAMLASLLVAYTLVPASSQLSLFSRKNHNNISDNVNKYIGLARKHYIEVLDKILEKPGKFVVALLVLLFISFLLFATLKNSFLPHVDEGVIRISVRSDSGTQLEDMDNTVKKLEEYFISQKQVKTVFTTAGGFVFGRFQRESSRYSSIKIQLVPLSRRNISTNEFVRKARRDIAKMNLVGIKVWMRVQGVRGIRINHGNDDLNIKIQGPNIDTLRKLGDQTVQLLEQLPQLHNISHNYDEFGDELVIELNRERISNMGLTMDTIGQSIQLAMTGLVAGGILQDDREYPVTLNIAQQYKNDINKLKQIIVAHIDKTPVRIADIAEIHTIKTPSRIKRENQRRIVEISASIRKDSSLSELESAVKKQLEVLSLPAGYVLYQGDTFKTMHKDKKNTVILVLLAIFMVFVVMAIQYESLINPFVILLSIPFMFIGVTAGLYLFSITVTMPVWLGIIMLFGIVVNNAIVLVEQIERNRRHDGNIKQAIKNAAGLRLRPILMTTLTTVTGMLPLAFGLGEGSEMLQPLAIVIVAGLSFSLLISLLLIPVTYVAVHRHNLATN